MTPRTQVRLALVSACAAAAIVAACGGGDDSSTPHDAGPTTKGDAAPAGSVDSGHIVTGAPDGAFDGMIDAATVDAGIPAVSCAGYLYCEDFESYDDAGSIANSSTLGPWKTSVGGKNDAGQTITMGVDGVNPYSGSRALHLTAPAGEGTNGTLNRATNPDGGDIGGSLFGRAMIYYSGAPLPGGSAPLTDSGTYGLPVGPPKQGNHIWIFQGYGPSPQLKDQVSVNILVGTPYLAINYQPGPDAGYGESEKSGAEDAGPVTLGAWHCLQWEYDGPAATPGNVIKVWFDGNLDVSVDSHDEDAAVKLASDWTSMSLGFTHYQLMANAVDVYLDDFALNNQMVPCPTP